MGLNPDSLLGLRVNLGELRSLSELVFLYGGSQFAQDGPGWPLIPA